MSLEIVGFGNRGRDLIWVFWGYEFIKWVYVDEKKKVENGILGNILDFN